MGRRAAAQRCLRRRRELDGQPIQIAPPIVEPSRLLRLPEEILVMIIRLTCNHERRHLHSNSAHPCDIVLWNLVHTSLACIATPILWRQVRIASVAQATALDAILANDRGAGRAAGSVLFITVDSIGKENRELSTVSQDLINQILQRCVNLKRLVAPILDFKSVIRITPFLPHLQSLSISKFTSLARKNDLGISNVLASLSTLTHLEIDADLLLTNISTAPKPTFSLSSLSWAAGPKSSEKLDWVL
ncbi:hypothetical protein FRB93_000695 [Tulasnella sp. JGI-2019a]|nr:hypothetical protein FRB93_000695 [Tulasnella sp. JGI-2019a]